MAIGTCCGRPGWDTCVPCKRVWAVASALASDFSFPLMQALHGKAEVMAQVFGCLPGQGCIPSAQLGSGPASAARDLGGVNWNMGAACSLSQVPLKFMFYR